MSQLSEQASPAGMSSCQQPQVLVNNVTIVGDKNNVKNNDSSCLQVNSSSGSDSSRPPSPNCQRKDDRHYVTTKTLTLIALCSTKAEIPVRFLLMVVEFARVQVPSELDRYRSQIISSLNLKFDPFLSRNKNRDFKIQRKCNLFKDLLRHECAKKDGILDLGKLYRKVFCVEDDKEWQLQQELLPHLDKWFSLVEEDSLESSLSAEFLTMCLHAFGKFRWTGWEDRLKTLSEKCLEHCKDASVDMRERMLREIGETCRKLCYHSDAERYLEMALDVHETSSSVDESIPYQISRMFLARCKIDMGDYQAAHDLMMNCLDSKAVKDLEGELGRPYLRCRMYFEMARSCEKLGKFDHAYQYCSKALEDDRREDGFRYPQYLMYAAFYKAMSTVEGSDRVLVDCARADSILEKRHGKDHHHRAHVLCIQARIWLSRNDTEEDPTLSKREAFRLAERACHITEVRYGYEHIKVAKMFELLGDIHKALDNDEKAWKAYWMAKNMYSERQHSRADDIEQKMSNMPEFKTPAPTCKKSNLFEELLM